METVVQGWWTRRKYQKEISIVDKDNVCGHIHTLYANLEILKELFPMYFAIPDTKCDNESDTPQQEVLENADDIHIQQYQVYFFIFHKSKW